MLTVQKMRRLPFENASVERYRWRNSSAEQALNERYLTRVSVRRVEDITQVLWVERVSASTVSDLMQWIAGRIDEWRPRLLAGDSSCVLLDGFRLTRSSGCVVKAVPVLIAIGVAQSGYPEILGVSERVREDKNSRTTFLHELSELILKGVKLIIWDKSLGPAKFYLKMEWQGCAVHFYLYRDVWTPMPKGKVWEVAQMVRAIRAPADVPAAKGKARQMVSKLHEMRLAKAAEIVEARIDKPASYYSVPPEHWRSIKTNKRLERLMREIPRRKRVAGSFPDGHSALKLAVVRLGQMAATDWVQSAICK